MDHKEMYAEFGNSLGALVRTDEDGEVNDMRDGLAHGATRQTVAVFLDTMADVPYDVAAIFSACAGVNERSLFEIRALEGNALKERLVLQQGRGALPLRFADDHRMAHHLFEGFLASVAGCELYRDVALLLARGYEDRDFKHWLPADLYEMMERGERVEYAAEEEGESVDEGSEDDDSEDNRREERDDDYDRE